MVTRDSDGVGREIGTLLLEEIVSDEDTDPSSSESCREPQPWRRRKSHKALAGAVLAAALGMLAIAGFSCLSLRTPTIREGAALQLATERRMPSWFHQPLYPLAVDPSPRSLSRCHTAVANETCYLDVKWAMDVGIQGHPDWYKEACPTLRSDGPFENFQACVHRINATSCPAPCSKAASSAASASSVSPAREKQQRLQAPVPEQAPVISKGPCHIAEEDDRCFEAVVTAMLTGLTEHPHWFPGLTPESKFEQFQAALHKGPHDTTCPRPCDCHTSMVNESCYKKVIWAMTEGINDHPKWFKSLTLASTFEEVQAFLHRDEDDGRDTCPQPCSPVTFKSLRGQTMRSSIPEIAGMLPDECRTAKPGTKCHKSIIFAMKKGMYEHPDWYPGLSALSSFEEFQVVLHPNEELECPRPCKCETAKPGTKCYDNIAWVLREGIVKNPEWYPGIDPQTRWEKVQERVHQDKNSVCPMPCSPTPWGTPSIYCFAVFRSTGYEVDLVRGQVAKGAGIFSCDEFAVLSDRELAVSDSIKTLIIPPCEDTGVSKDGTAANTEIFIQAWTVIWNATKFKSHDWIVKADPDAVVIVSRLRQHLGMQTTPKVWMKNCMKWTGPGWPMMFGSLEAFSRGAMEAYFEGAAKCRDNLDWQSWGEDLFMGNCLSMLDAPSAFDEHLIGDNVCKGANCADGVSAAYHPFKTPEDWFHCYDQATGAA